MKPLLESVDCVLFDLDGTLVDTNIDFPLMKREMIALAVEQGLEPAAFEREDILAIIEITIRHLITSGKHDKSLELHHRAMVILEEIELRHARNTQEIPFARELISELKDWKIGVGIVTRNCRNASNLSLEIAQITPDVLLCREDTLRHKPNPEPLNKALKALDAKPHASIMVGDHIMDILSGKAANMKTIGFLREDRPRSFFDEVAPDFVALSLEEVSNAIIDRNR